MGTGTSPGGRPVATRLAEAGEESTFFVFDPYETENPAPSS